MLCISAVSVRRSRLSVMFVYCVKATHRPILKLLDECYYMVHITLALCSHKSVCVSVCTSSVTLVHCTQTVELFGNIFAPSNSLGTRIEVCTGRKFDKSKLA